MDKVIYENSLGIRDTKKIMNYFYNSSDKKSKYIIFECINRLLEKYVSVPEQYETIIKNMVNWIDEYPYDYEWKELYKLDSYTSQIMYDKVQRLTFEEFLDTIASLTDDEVLELIGNYKMLYSHEYRKDPRKILYSITQKEKSKYL